MPSLPKYITTQSHKHPIHSAFALKIGNTTHNMLVAPSLGHQLLTKRDVIQKVNMRDAVYRIMETFWGDHNKVMRNTITQEALFGPIHGALTNMMREEFVISSLSYTTKAVEDNITSMISGLSSIVDMPRWERTAGVEVTPSSKSLTAEANLFHLIRDFVGDMTTAVLMGNDFATNYPDCVADVWTADPAMIPLMLGVPEWFPSMHASVRARNRLIDAVTEHHTAYIKYTRGEDPGMKWGNMDDVSTVIRDRALALDKAGSDAVTAGRCNAVIIWAMNVNAPIIIFWMIWHIYNDPTLLADLRAEIAPYVKLHKSTGATGGIKEKDDVEINLDGLRKKCPLLQGTFLETMRMETASNSYKNVTEDFMLEESEEDAVIFGRSKDDRRRYLFKKGEFVVIPHSAHQSDERYFPEPQKFDARRFWVKKEVKGEEDEIRVDYKTMRPWGGGKEVCKGRRFAEGEVVLFVAAVVAFWEIEPAEEKPWYAGLGEDVGGVLKMGGGAKGWRHPGRKEGVGAVQPKDMDRCRVILKRREVTAE